MQNPSGHHPAPAAAAQAKSKSLTPTAPRPPPPPPSPAAPSSPGRPPPPPPPPPPRPPPHPPSPSSPTVSPSSPAARKQNPSGHHPAPTAVAQAKSKSSTSATAVATAQAKSKSSTPTVVAATSGQASSTHHHHHSGGGVDASASTLKHKRGVFQKDLQHMMYGFGDDPNPLPETVALVEDIVVEYVTDPVVPRELAVVTGVPICGKSHGYYCLEWWHTKLLLPVHARCGFGESLHLLEQPGSAHRLVGWRRRSLRRLVDGRLLLWLCHHLNVKILSCSPKMFSDAKAKTFGILEIKSSFLHAYCEN